MTVANVTEISTVFPNGFEEALRQSIERTT
jgi:hypothetical protein